MKKIFGIIALLVTAGLIAYFVLLPGEDEKDESTDQEDEAPTNEQEEKETKNEYDGGEEEVDTNLAFTLEADGNKMQYTVKNEGDATETLTFPTSQKYEYEISDESGLVAKYSKGKGFLQAIQEIPLEPNEEMTLEVELPSLEPGNYTITIYLTARDLSQASQINETFELLSDNSIIIN
ncbi:BsuPI-related putative proteinase inhibitor [Oceanobacillus luteolus]|uniref:BsuPI-related putative proteinase inhibitor n=1 Tax=Oceanobacillus luteolus TaxID=1274358 RepID=UPI00203FDFB5|nr:BsuPI-related putative proteinase inhibitor [Oceanobacillus luteolus]MCM3742067.1 BsuPI-related putative proteinase inhibitor [Oceanobacillus luteolus]